MTLKNMHGEALAVAEKNGRIVKEIICSRGILDAAIDALGRCRDAAQAHRILSKACEDVSARLKGAFDA